MCLASHSKHGRAATYGAVQELQKGFTDERGDWFYGAMSKIMPKRVLVKQFVEEMQAASLLPQTVQDKIAESDAVFTTCSGTMADMLETRNECI